MINLKWFTLIELIVWIAISTMLMIWVSVFITSWMKNINIQKNILDNNVWFVDFYNDLSTNFSNNFEIIDKTSTWIFIKSNYSLNKSLFRYIWEKTFTWKCSNDTDIETKYLIIDDFSAFEWKGGDLFWDYNYNSWISINWFLSQINSYSWDYLFPTDLAYWSGNDFFVSDEKQNVIYKFDKSNFLKKWQIIAWNKAFWQEIWLTATSSYLNHPTWITFYAWKLFISDSWNDRILAMSWNNLYEILNRNDWLNNPTWIVFNNSWDFLISNSNNKEILKVNYKKNTFSNINIDFKTNSNLTANKIILDFSWALTSLSWTYSTWNFAFNWTKWNWDYLVQYSNKLEYNMSWSINFVSWSLNTIKINPFNANFSYGLFFTKLDIYNSSTKLFEKYISNWNIWDDDILTKTNNEVSVFASWVNFPTWIYKSWSDIIVNDLYSRNYLKYNNSWSLLSTWALNNVNFAKIPNLKTYLQIKDLNIYNSWNLLTIKVDYYKNFSCLDPNENIIKTLIYKKYY